jgi:hypothetical protein
VSTAASNFSASPDAASIAGVVIRGRSAESPALADGLFNAADPKPNADFTFVRLFRADRADQTQSQQAGEALLVFRDEAGE